MDRGQPDTSKYTAEHQQKFVSSTTLTFNVSAMNNLVRANESFSSQLKVGPVDGLSRAHDSQANLHFKQQMKDIFDDLDKEMTIISLSREKKGRGPKGGHKLLKEEQS